MAETVTSQILETLYQRLAIAIKLLFLQFCVKLAMPPLTHPD